MSKLPWHSIAKKAYQQALKYEDVSEEKKQELFCFIHDWFRQIEDINYYKQNNEETPDKMYKKIMETLKICQEKNESH